MMFPVLMTKLHKPSLPDSAVSREVLLTDSGWASVILVSAQAGSGKSTVVSAWLSEQSKPYCWYSLDDWDNDLMQFFGYLAEGMKPIDKHVSESLKQLLDAFQSVGFEEFLRAFINQLHTIQSPFILVLDDYHVIRNEQIHHVLKTMLEHFPQSMQLVVITREDPPFPFAKMRANKRILELRISELRFTEDEVNVYFSQRLHCTLEAAQLRLLFQRTEGWIAGLQMAALSMQSVDDIDNFIQTFTGSHNYIMDYLIEEVLESHPQEIKEFLLKTSMLDFFSGDLCDALLRLETGTGSSIIQRLVKTNSFIISTDSSHQWYRYHHLFSDLLRQRLDLYPKNEPETLHLRAGYWFKTNGHEQEAIQHFLKANAFKEAAALIECKWAEMDIQLQSASWLDMAKKLPADIIERSPVLALGYGWALLDAGMVEAGKEWLDKARNLYDRCQSAVCPEDIMIADKAQFDLFPATIASAYAYICAATGDVDGLFAHTHDALSQIPAGQDYKRGVVGMLLAVAHWGTGNLQAAETATIEALKSMRRAKNLLTENSFYMVLGELYIQQGSLIKAKALFEQTISSVMEQKQVPILLPSLYLGLAKVAFLRKENSSAYALLQESRAYGQRCALIDWKYKYYLLLCRVYYSEGFYDLAHDCIMESKAYYSMNPLPDEVTLEDMEIMIDNAKASPPSDSISKEERFNKNETPPFKRERANQSLTEALTGRELEVLALIVEGLSNQEICDTLFLALSTVKSYNQNIYEKLQVNRRTQAVAKAQALGLV